MIITVNLKTDIVLSKITIFLISNKNKFNNSSVFNDFSSVSSTTIATYLMFMITSILINDY